MDSEVFINGRSAGTWKYGYSSFEVDITPYLEAGENELLVRVVHRSPNSRWYSGAGIYRSVYLIERERTHIASSGLYITPVKREASDTWDVEVEVEAAQGADDEKPFDSIRYIITQKNGKHDMRSNEEDSLCIIFNQLIGEKAIYTATPLKSQPQSYGTSIAEISMNSGRSLLRRERFLTMNSRCSASGQ